jgi:hypothetical protein
MNSEKLTKDDELLLEWRQISDTLISTQGDHPLPIYIEFMYGLDLREMEFLSISSLELASAASHTHLLCILYATPKRNKLDLAGSCQSEMKISFFLLTIFYIWILDIFFSPRIFEYCPFSCIEVEIEQIYL